MALSFNVPLPYGEHRFTKLVVPSLGLVRGESPGLSVVVPEGTPVGALVESENFEELAKEPLKYQWRNQGLPVQPLLRDFTINGKAGNGDRPDLAAEDPAKLFDAVRLYASGASVSGVHIVDVPGAGLITLRGTSNRVGARDVHDSEVTRISDIRVIGALGYGWRVDGAHSDGTSHSVDIGGVRGDAFYTGPYAGGWTHTALHTYASDRGIVVHGVNVFVGCQGETCKTGTYVASTAAGSKFLGHRSFANSEVGVLLDGQAEFSAAYLLAAKGTAVLIREGAVASSISGYLGLERTATGVAVDADKVTLKLKCWGGGTQVVVGATRPVSECVIEVNCDGCDTGIEVRNIGKNNTIRLISHPGRMKRTIVLPANWDTSNRIEEVKAA